MPDQPDMLCHVSRIDAETQKAYGVKDSRGVLVWLPKSQVSLRTRHPNGFTLVVPAWLAEKNDTLEFEEE